MTGKIPYMMLVLGETVTFDDRDTPWITSCIKKMINEKHLAFKRFMNKKGFVNNNSNLQKFSFLQNKFSSLIENSNQEYFSKTAKKVSDHSTSSKTHWFILKCFWTAKKIPFIRPIFYENEFMTDFREKD